MKLALLTIGDEILIGQIVDTNSAWISKKLNEIGVKVKKILSIADSADEIKWAVNLLMSENDIVLVTGGLGPTKDDITKTVLCEIFNTKLVFNQEVLDNVNELLGKRNVPVNNNNYNQAMIPENAKILLNKKGTAPAMLFEKNNSYLISMPGVPFEMKHITETYVIPFIKEKFKTNNIFHKTLVTFGIAESVLAEMLENVENSMPDYMKLAYLPTPGYIRLRLSIYDYKSEYQDKVDEVLEEIKKVLGNKLLAEDDLKPEIIIGNLLSKQGKTISTAESCTGGRIASLLTSIAGSSKYFYGSVVAYDNSIKENILNISSEDLEKYGAVSQQVVEQMAKGVLELLKTDYAISTSGIAGPDGGTIEKPVGTVWIGIASKTKTISRKFSFFNDREINIQRATNTALALMIEFLRVEENSG
ncbi:MAG: competence/damage-inducible protein A [Bacteroidales bacterium]|jgi:nicotinamide-nucleotide amidase|nr:competence/damage-inducible protein A [Bacteroidales bacterium]NLB85879.1 competence/damage-inducible protein A [Bacteroidales bacterium]